LNSILYVPSRKLLAYFKHRKMQMNKLISNILLIKKKAKATANKAQKEALKAERALQAAAR